MKPKEAEYVRTSLDLSKIVIDGEEGSHTNQASTTKQLKSLEDYAVFES